MTFQIVTEPIDRWPLPDTKNRSSIQFKASYGNTLDLLRRELDLLGAKGNVVLQVVTRNGATDLRRDGALRAQAKIEHPGVRLSFESKHGSLTYATDQFAGRYYGDMPGWQANLRAIALGLEALRTVDRYGISKSGEQYRGWRAIESREPTLTREQALEVLRKHDPNGVFADKPLSSLLRFARAAAHPDRHGGDRGQWDDVERAARALGLLS